MAKFARLWFASLGILGLCMVAPVHAQDAKPGLEAKAAFEVLKSLAGEWKGVEKDGHTPQINYRVISGGSVVMETYFPGTDHEMVSMYHLEGDELRAIHYCAARNQPHIKLDKKASTKDKLVFMFDGGTNFDPAKDMHMHSGWISIKNKDHVEAEWDGHMEGKKLHTEKFDLKRS